MRADDQADGRADATFDPVAAGILLGLANTVMCAVGLAIAEPSRELGGAIVVFGFLPGMLIGAFEGGLARLTRHSPPWLRVVLLAPIPLGFVYVLASALMLHAPAYGPCIPTFVAVLLLERVTRTKALVPRVRALGR